MYVIINTYVSLYVHFQNNNKINLQKVTKIASNQYYYCIDASEFCFLRKCLIK